MANVISGGCLRTLEREYKGTPAYLVYLAFHVKARDLIVQRIVLVDEDHIVTEGVSTDLILGEFGVSFRKSREQSLLVDEWQ